MEGVGTERPLDANAKKKKKTKKQKREEKGSVTAPAPLKESEKDPTQVPKPPSSREQEEERKSDQRRQKKAQKKEKAEKKAAKAEAKRERKAQKSALENDVHDEALRLAGHEEENTIEDIAMEPVPLETKHPDNHQPSTASSTSPERSPNFDTPMDHSGSSSVSSIQPSISSDNQRTHDDTKDAPAPFTPTSKPDPAEIQARFQSRIEALRAARKADGPNGAPARNRQELLEARRQKEAARKLHKKELRQKAKEDEARKKAETLARGSPLLSPGSPMSPSADPSINNFSFGRVNFEGGEQASASLDSILDRKGKQKGPSDPATALVAAQNKQQRLASLDSAKQSDMVEKDTWLNAKKRAQGERIRDDTSLLKKTLKRKQKQKKKSEKEWGDRIEGVQKGQEMKQKKREANLKKRKEEKGGKGKQSKKPKARAGFEGSFRAKAPSSGGLKGKK